MLQRLCFIRPQIKMKADYRAISSIGMGKLFQEANTQERDTDDGITRVAPDLSSSKRLMKEMLPTARVIPMLVNSKEPVVLSFDDIPGPKALKHLSTVRQYLSEAGTQLTAAALTIGLNFGTYLNKRKPLKNLSTLFEEYGPVVRFVSPVGKDVVLITHPDHIQKVYTLEGNYPIRSALDCLEKYRLEHKKRIYSGLYTVQGDEWTRQREAVNTPLQNSIAEHFEGLSDTCDMFTQKIYNLRNHQDEMPKDFYREIHKWAFDCVGLIIFAKRFSMLETEMVYSQCDMSWLYHSLEEATEAIIKCETGIHLWKFFATPAWTKLIKYCDSLDSLIGKYVLEVEQALACKEKDDKNPVKGENSLIHSMLVGEEKMTPEDMSTIITDMLLIGVNAISSSMSFMLFFISKYQRTQRILYQEITNAYPDESFSVQDIIKIKNNTPYLQACIKETLRLVPPIPLLTRILPKNITLDRYNIPRGTMILMSTQDSSLKECNFDDADKFYPERWLKPEVKDYHAFASIPFGYGARKCLGQNIAESMMSLLTIKVMQKFKLEYHYGDIEPSRNFISRPKNPLKIRFIDRF